MGGERGHSFESVDVTEQVWLEEGSGSDGERRQDRRERRVKAFDSWGWRSAFTQVCAVR